MKLLDKKETNLISGGEKDNIHFLYHDERGFFDVKAYNVCKDICGTFAEAVSCGCSNGAASVKSLRKDNLMIEGLAEWQPLEEYSCKK